MGSLSKQIVKLNHKRHAVNWAFVQPQTTNTHSFNTFNSFLSDNGKVRSRQELCFLFVGWLLNVPATYYDVILNLKKKKKKKERCTSL